MMLKWKIEERGAYHICYIPTLSLFDSLYISMQWDWDGFWFARTQMLNCIGVLRSCIDVMEFIFVFIWHGFLALTLASCRT